jgi:uncharacterized membrane protein
VAKTARPGVVLPTPAQAKQWEEVRPGTFDRLMAEIEREEKNRRRLAWAELASRVFGQICALATVGILALLAWHYVDQGAATQGASIIVSGAVFIVGVFVTGRLTNQRQRTAVSPGADAGEG